MSILKAKVHLAILSYKGHNITKGLEAFNTKHCLILGQVLVVTRVAASARPNVTKTKD